MRAMASASSILAALDCKAVSQSNRKCKERAREQIASSLSFIVALTAAGFITIAGLAVAVRAACTGVSHGDHLRDGESPARLEDSEGLVDDRTFVGGKVDHAVGDDDVHGVIGQGYLLNVAFDEADVFDACFALVLLGQGKHLVGHIQAVSEA